MIILLLVPGCLGSGPIGTSATTTTEPPPPSTDVNRPETKSIPIRETMRLLFENDVEDLEVLLQPASVMSPYGTFVDGSILTLDQGVRTWTFGLGPCMTPMWTQRNNVTWMATAGYDGRYFGEIPAFLLSPATVFAAPANETLRLANMTHKDLPGTPFLLAAAETKYNLASYWAHWWDDGRPSGPRLEVDQSWHSQRVAPGNVPAWIQRRSDSPWLILDRMSVTSEGREVEPCDEFATLESNAPRQALTPMATAADPPVDWSLHEMLDVARDHPSLPTYREWSTHPDVAIYEWAGTRGEKSGLAVGDANLTSPYKWRLMFARGPDAAQPRILYIQCERTVTDTAVIPGITVDCTENTLEGPEPLHPLPAIDFSAASIPTYTWIFDLYRTLFEKEACDLTVSFNAVTRPPQFDSKPLIGSITVGCGYDLPEMLVDAQTGSLQGFRGPPLPNLTR